MITPMKMKYLRLLGPLLGIMACDLFAADTGELPLGTNHLLRLSLLDSAPRFSLTLQEGSRATDEAYAESAWSLKRTGTLLDGLSLEMPTTGIDTSSWFLRPVGVVPFSGVEWAERLNAQAIRRQREGSEEARKTGWLVPVPPLYPSRVGQLLDRTK